jgi:hypothetical protein
MLLCVVGIVITVFLSPQKWYIDILEILKACLLIGVGYFGRMTEE